MDSTSGLSVGSEVFVRRVATTNWIHDLGMDLLGPPPDVPWTTGGYMLDMDRTITHIEGNRIFGGTVTGDGDIIAGGGTSTIAISNGVLAVTGVVGMPAAPIGKVALTNATLQFSVDTVTTNLVATTLTTGGSSNVINILSLPSVSVPTQVALVEYTNAIGGAGFNFVLGSLVSGGGFSGYLSNNVANSSVDLAFVSLPAAPPGFRTVKLSGTNFIASGTNGVPGWPYFILVSTNVALPLNQWTSMATNQFDAGGNFTFTNNVSPGPPQKFYLLKLL